MYCGGLLKLHLEIRIEIPGMSRYNLSKWLVFTICFFLLLLTGDVVYGAGKNEIVDTSRTADWKPSPTGAAFRSLFFPGWGQAYVGKPLKAVIYGGIEEGLIFSVYLNHKFFTYYNRIGEDRIAENYREDRNRLTWYLAGAIILSMLDAFVDAHLYSFNVSENLAVIPVRVGVKNGGVVFTLSRRFR